MAVTFERCTLAGLGPLSLTAPSGFVIGVVGGQGSGKQRLLRLATGTLPADSGTVLADSPCRFHGPLDGVILGEARTLALYHTLALKDSGARASAAMELELFRRRGGSAFLVSHELDLIEWLADEVWWLHAGQLAAKGDPRETLDRYRRHTASQMRKHAAGKQQVLPPAMRRGDGRAVLLSIETLDEIGTPVAVWQSGANVQVRIRVQYLSPVEDPVIGMLIRTRIGFEVYGTNTELEKLKLGPCSPGDIRTVVFSFACHLCPHEYTLTAASHDPDGVWHDWVEDGVAFAVSDARYTAGVACLRANVRFGNS